MAECCVDVRLTMTMPSAESPDKVADWPLPGVLAPPVTCVWEEPPKGTAPGGGHSAQHRLDAGRLSFSLAAPTLNSRPHAWQHSVVSDVTANGVQRRGSPGTRAAEPLVMSCSAPGRCSANRNPGPPSWLPMSRR